MSEGLGVFSVVICAYTIERWSELAQAIASVRAQTIPPREIILVVDHNPELFARARETLSDVTVVENQQPRGLSDARNSGIAVAGGEIIAFLDDDATAAPDWLAQLSTGYADPNVVGVGGAILPHWLSRRPTWFPEEFNWVIGCDYRGLPQMTAPVRNLVASSVWAKWIWLRDRKRRSCASGPGKNYRHAFGYTSRAHESSIPCPLPGPAGGIF